MDFRRLLRGLNFELDEGAFQWLCAQADSASTGAIDFERFVAKFVNAANAPVTTTGLAIGRGDGVEHGAAVLKALAPAPDDGRWTVSEVRKVLEMKIQLKTTAVRRAFAAAGTNGRLGPAELRTALEALNIYMSTNDWRTFAAFVGPGLCSCDTLLKRLGVVDTSKGLGMDIRSKAPAAHVPGTMQASSSFFSAVREAGGKKAAVVAFNPPVAVPKEHKAESVPLPTGGKENENENSAGPASKKDKKERPRSAAAAQRRARALKVHQQANAAESTRQRPTTAGRARANGIPVLVRWKLGRRVDGIRRAIDGVPDRAFGY